MRDHQNIYGGAKVRPRGAHAPMAPTLVSVIKGEREQQHLWWDQKHSAGLGAPGRGKKTKATMLGISETQDRKVRSVRPLLAREGRSRIARWQRWCAIGTFGN